MPDDSKQLTRRRLLGSVVTVAGASAAAGGGTMALFADSESSTGNTVQSGTLNLTLDGDDRSVTFLTKTGVMPGDSGSPRLPLKNEGTIDGDLQVSLAGIRSTDKNGTSPGDLEEYLLVRGVVETPSGPVGIFDQQTVASLRGTTISHTPVGIPASESRDFVLEWELPESTQNKAKSDSVEIDFGFNLTQGVSP